LVIFGLACRMPNYNQRGQEGHEAYNTEEDGKDWRRGWSKK